MSLNETLSRSEVFGGLDAGQWSRIAMFCRPVSYRQGSTIFEEGDEALEFYVLDSGRVSLEVDIRPVSDLPAIPTALEIVAGGECFGWSALVEPHRYTTSARCLNHCSLLAIRGEMLKRAMDSDHDLGYKLMKKIAHLVSLRLMYARLRLVSGHGLAVFAGESHAAGS